VPQPLGQALADQALENLVNQFARPLDFLRELVQNSIDAGSPRVEVWLRWSEGVVGSGALSGGARESGVLEIGVDDFGEGMDEALIDTRLTRMFESSKEDDLTRIGRFGIGFTSIFAIEPHAVLLRTGRHGESWELLFHADRSFDKIRLDAPVVGTQITLLRPMPRDEVAAFVAECRWVLGFWCEHSDTPILFADRTTVARTEASDDSDPFAAFARPSQTWETISAPLLLDDATLSTRLERDGVEVLVGVGGTPRFAFYNRGLTLMNTADPDALGPRRDALGHLSFKVKSPHLEHTLTRDSVLQDIHWHRALDLVAEAAAELARRLPEAMQSAADRGEALGEWHGLVSAMLIDTDLASTVAWVPVAAVEGGTRTVAQIEEEGKEMGGDWVLLDDGPTPLSAALVARGVSVLVDHPKTRALLASSAPRRLLPIPRRRERRLASPEELFILPRPVETSELSVGERALVAATAALLAQVSLRPPRLRVGDFVGGDGELCVTGPEQMDLLPRRAGVFDRLRRRCVLIDRSHPTWQTHALAAVDDTALAAFGLAQAILTTLGRGTPRLWKRLLDVALP